MNEQTLAEEFELQRPRLRAVAYRMLGSTGEADDAVQEAWLRLSRADSDAVSNLGGWLTTVVGRVCLDMLRSRQARREDELDDLPPELLISTNPAEDPAAETELAESVGLALLVVLEALSPAERLAFVLHDMFGVSFSEVGEILGRSPDATRQLASRARRRVRGSAPPADADLATQRELVDAFLTAARSGDFEELVGVLHPDVVFRVHGAPRPETPPVGAAGVAQAILERGAPFAPLARPALVNGHVGAIVAPEGRVFSVVSFAFSDGKIAGIDVIVGPERLEGFEIRE